MNVLKLFIKRETAAPLLALLFASIVSVTLVCIRVVQTKNLLYGSLAWNLFLAWLPLIFAILARETFHRGQQRTWRFYTLAGAWLLFFPNAPYIFTDLIHLTTGFFRYYWIDLTLVLLCAFTGLVLGFVSLYLMQSVVARVFGKIAGWLFVAITAGLSSFGIYLGRFLRINSWDVFVNPGKVYDKIMYHRADRWIIGPWINGHTTSFLVLFATFLFLAYVMLYGLTQLPRFQSPGSDSDLET